MNIYRLVAIYSNSQMGRRVINRLQAGDGGIQAMEGWMRGRDETDTNR